jgi:hypothetical protein
VRKTPVWLLRETVLAMHDLAASLAFGLIKNHPFGGMTEAEYAAWLRTNSRILRTP